ncbi:MAG: pitrilysin family protein [Ferruginibacter sp.]
MMKFYFLRYGWLYGLLVLIHAGVSAQSNTVEFDVDGLKVILRQTQKETLAMNMYFRGGSSNYTAANAGIESLALTGITECGTAKYPATEFNDQRDEYGLHLFGDVTNDYGVLKMRCITSYMNEAWKLFASAIASPSFESQKFLLLKERKISGLKAELSRPDARLERLAQEFAFNATPYAINPDGTVASLESINRDAVKEYYYNTLLNRNRMFLVVAGNISKEDLEKKIKEDLASIPTREYVPGTITASFFSQDAFKIENRPLATNYLCGIINAPGLDSRDYPAFRFTISILHSRLFDVIRLQKNLSYAPSATMTTGRISYATLYASTSNPPEVIRAMRNVLAEMKQRFFSEKTIESIRRHLSVSIERNQEVMEDIAGWLGRAEIAGSWKLSEGLEERMAAVTAADIQSVVNRYARHVAWVYLGDEAMGERAFNETD